LRRTLVLQQVIQKTKKQNSKTSANVFIFFFLIFTSFNKVQNAEVSDTTGDAMKNKSW
jgi:hypothetical protein